MSNVYQHQDIIDFWYSDRVQSLWFVSIPEFDEEIAQRFEGLWQEAAEGGLNQWQETPMSVLALAIVLDQFPLNMFRGTVKSFITEKLAITVVKDAIKKGFNKQIPKDKLSFLYMHSCIVNR